MFWTKKFIAVYKSSPIVKPYLAHRQRLRIISLHFNTDDILEIFFSVYI